MSNNGIAVWSSLDKKFNKLCTLEFWAAYFYFCEWITLHKSGTINLNVIIEDNTQNKPRFTEKYKTKIAGKRNNEDSVLEHISQSIGENKAVAKLWIKFFENNGIKVQRIKPTKKSITKISHQQFCKMTHFDGKHSNEHSRDAAMLVYGR